MRLQAFFAMSASFLGSLGIVSAVSLVWTTSALRQGTFELGEAIESVRAAEELELSLLVHDHEWKAGEAIGSHAQWLHAQELDVRKWIGRVEQHIGSDREREMVRRARLRSEEYLRSGVEGRPATLHAAIEAAGALTELNVLQARAARDRAAQINDLANLIGTVVALLLVVGIAGVIVAAHVRLYRPLLALRAGIMEYKTGNKAQRLRRFGVRELREIAEEFNDMAETLAKQDESQLQFVAAVAHELRNPLQALKTSAWLLERGEPSFTDESRRAVGRISRQADRLSRIVEDLLDRARIRCGVLELQIEECELRELAAEVVEEQRTASERHSFDFVQPDEPIVLRCDPTRVSQVLTNLIINAIKYSPDGGRIRVRVDAEKDRALVEVSDEGLGIPETERERIFEPFGRSENVPRGIPGAGLGLYVSRSIVHAHGGNISVESAPGTGTTFRIQLPQAVPGDAPIGETL